MVLSQMTIFVEFKLDFPQVSKYYFGYTMAAAVVAATATSDEANDTQNYFALIYDLIQVLYNGVRLYKTCIFYIYIYTTCSNIHK